MIIENLPNTNPYSFGSGNAYKLLGPAISEPDPSNIPEFCICDFVTCDYVEKVFTDPSSNDFWKNDKNEFLFKRFVSIDTVDIELYKDNIKVADLNNNALGEFFNGFPSGSAEQQLYVGYLLDWKLVQAAHGFGEYQVKAQLDIIGNVTEYESRIFKLCFFNDILASGSVRIETVQNGNIIGSQFDFTGLEWRGSFRLPGFFGNPTPVYESDIYVTEQRKRKQIQDRMEREWSLSIKQINWEVANSLVYNKLLANEILITDYNIYAESVWRRISVKTKEVEKPAVFGNPKKIYNVKFIDEKDKYIKRNF